MNSDQDYGFDVAGFIRLPQVLTAEEMQACTQAIDAVGRDEGMLEWPAPWGEAALRVAECDAARLSYAAAGCKSTRYCRRSSLRSAGPTSSWTARRR